MRKQSFFYLHLCFFRPLQAMFGIKCLVLMVASALTHSPMPHLPSLFPQTGLVCYSFFKTYETLSHVRTLPVLFSLLEHPGILHSGLTSQSKVTFSRLTVKLRCLDCGVGRRTDTLADGTEESTEDTGLGMKAALQQRALDREELCPHLTPNTELI